MFKLPVNSWAIVVELFEFASSGSGGKPVCAQSPALSLYPAASLAESFAFDSGSPAFLAELLAALAELLAADAEEAAAPAAVSAPPAQPAAFSACFLALPV